MKKTKLRKVSTKSAKNKAWRAFSLYIRARDKKCVTCGYDKSLQAGHFLGGRHLSVLFDERNCHAQCYGCNIARRGNPAIYYQFMEKRYGIDTINELIEEDKEIVQYKTADYQELERVFKDKLALLAKPM